MRRPVGSRASHAIRPIVPSIFERPRRLLAQTQGIQSVDITTRSDRKGDKGHDRGGNIRERSENYENYENQGRAIGTKMKADSNIAWSENGELKYKTETVRGSNVVDLVNDVLRKQKYFNPQGWETFGEAFREANVPQDLIGHEDGWRYISQMKRTPRSSKRQQSPSPIISYTPNHKETERKKPRTGSTFKTEVETTKGAVVDMDSTYYNLSAPVSYGILIKFKPKGYT